MTKDKPDYIVVIPARGGSKSIPMKNLVDLGGQPLITWTIESALGVFDRSSVFVSTDNKEIGKLSDELGVQVIWRGNQHSNDFSTSDSVLDHALSHCKNHKPALYARATKIAFLQPTSPFRSKEILKKSVLEFDQDTHSNSLISVKKVNPEYLKCFVEDTDGCLRGIHNNSYPFTPRQSLPPLFSPNGAIYLLKMVAFLENKSFFCPPVAKFVMKEWESLDIDTLGDLKHARLRLKKSRSFQ